MSHDIFISYSRRDTEKMQQVRDGLREAGLTVWTDEGIEPGTVSWRQALSDAISDCKSVVVLFSPDSAQSTWVNRELDFAELHRKKIYPLLVRGEIEHAVPFGFTTYQFIDIRKPEDFDNGVQDLISTLSHQYPTKLLITPSHPQVVDVPQVSPVDSPAEQTAPPQEEPESQSATSWKWIETPVIEMSVPSTWKIEEPTNQNMSRALVLNKDLPEMENFFYEFLQTETKLKGLASRHLLLRDISELSMVTGLVIHARIPMISRIILSGFMEKSSQKGFINQMLKSYSMAHKQTHVLKSRNNKIFIYEFEIADNMLFLMYQIYFAGTKDSLGLQITCEQKRYENEREQFERIARSMHLKYNRNS